MWRVFDALGDAPSRIPNRTTLLGPSDPFPDEVEDPRQQLQEQLPELRAGEGLVHRRSGRGGRDEEQQFPSSHHDSVSSRFKSSLASMPRTELGRAFQAAGISESVIGRIFMCFGLVWLGFMVFGTLVWSGGLWQRNWDGLEIDVVYTWVNGTDPANVAARQVALREWEMREPGSKAPIWIDGGGNRFQDYGNLAYSLRGLDMFAPWVRTIWLVVADGDAQVPQWLVQDHPRLRIVRHSDIWPSSQELAPLAAEFGIPGSSSWSTGLPSFNSHAIEANIFRIPGLAPWYWYLNDDVSVTAPIYHSDLFASYGGPDNPADSVTWGWFDTIPADDAEFWQKGTSPLCKGSNVRRCAYAATNALLTEREGPVETSFSSGKGAFMLHVPLVFSRQIMEQTYNSYKEAFLTSTLHPFRSSTDYFTNWLYVQLGLRSGRVRAASLWDKIIRTRYVLITTEYSASQMDWSVATTLIQRPKFLCVNDALDPDNLEAAVDRLQAMYRLLDTMYPIPSPWEKYRAVPPDHDEIVHLLE